MILSPSQTGNIQNNDTEMKDYTPITRSKRQSVPHDELN